MLTRRTFVALTVGIAALAFVGSVYLGWRVPAPPHRFHAAWKQTFDAPSALARGVDVVAVATAVSTRPGRIAYSDNGEDSLPFEEVTFDVDRGLKGASPGDTLVVERAGGVDHERLAVLLDADGGPFEIGTRYLLFLNRQEDGPFLYQVNDQGRFRVEKERLVAVSEDDPVAGFFHGRSLGESATLIHEHLRNPSSARDPR